MSTSRLTSDKIKNFALELGFDACGICPADVDITYFERYNDWLKSGYNAELFYLNKNLYIRKNPALLVENAKSLIVVIFNYFNNKKNADFIFAKYAYLIDYHNIIKYKLNQLLIKIQESDNCINGRVFCDSAPIFERYFAQKAGLGFIGKNNCFINETIGSFVFIGEIIIDKELEYDNENTKSCLGCNKCIKSCPTGALSEFCLIADKCISYQTIEKKTTISEDIAAKAKNRIFGCDICQEVCPHNNICVENPKIVQYFSNEVINFQIEEVEKMSESVFQKKFSQSALSRIKKDKILSDACLATTSLCRSS